MMGAAVNGFSYCLTWRAEARLSKFQNLESLKTCPPSYLFLFHHFSLEGIGEMKTQGRKGAKTLSIVCHHFAPLRLFDTP